jgi:hypothetical protein
MAPNIAKEENPLHVLPCYVRDALKFEHGYKLKVDF